MASDGKKLKKKTQNKTLTMPVFKVWINKDIQKLLVKIKAGEITLETSLALSSKVDWVSLLPPTQFTVDYRLETQFSNFLVSGPLLHWGLSIASQATE